MIPELCRLIGIAGRNVVHTGSLPRALDWDHMREVTILIVEDDPWTVRLLTEQLRMMDITAVLAAPDGTAALRCCAQTPPDIVLMDIGLPGEFDGIETASRVNEICDAAVVFITAYTDKDMRDRAARCSPYGFLLKPVLQEELLRQIHTTLKQRDTDRGFRDDSGEQQQPASALIETSHQPWSNDRLLDAIVRQFPNGAVAVVDAEYRYRLINGSELAVLGLSEDDFIGRRIQDLFQEETAKPLLRLVRSTLRGEPGTLELRYSDRDYRFQSMLLSDDTGGVRAVLLISQNVTYQNELLAASKVHSRELEERVRARTAQLESTVTSLQNEIRRRREVEQDLRNALDLARSEQEENFLLRHALEGTTDAVVLFDPDYTIHYANHVVESVAGKPRRELRGQDPAALFPHLSRGELSDIMNEVQACGAWSGVIPVMDMQGRQRIFSIAVTEVRVHVDKKAGYLGIGRDITERMEAEEREQENALFAALGRMSSTFAHEIKTPLTSIKMNIDMLRMESDGSVRSAQSFALIDRELERLTTLLRSTLGGLGGGSLQYSDVYLDTLVGEVVDACSSQIQAKRVRVTVAIPELCLRLDAARLRIALMNLVLNAVEAVPPQGDVRIEAERNDPGGCILRVRDNGMGLPNNVPVFRPFVTTKENGTGMGLPIARHLVEQQGGFLELEHSDDAGTVFRIILPSYGDGA